MIPATSAKKAQLIPFYSSIWNNSSRTRLSMFEPAHCSCRLSVRRPSPPFLCLSTWEDRKLPEPSQTAKQNWNVVAGLQLNWSLNSSQIRVVYQIVTFMLLLFDLILICCRIGLYIYKGYNTFRFWLSLPVWFWTFCPHLSHLIHQLLLQCTR